MSSLKGKADLWRTGKKGQGPAPSKQEIPGGGEKFAATSRFGGGAGYRDLPSSVDNQNVFANSVAGLAKDDKPFLPSPGSGRQGLDMYSIGSNPKEDAFGLDMSKQKKASPENP